MSLVQTETDIEQTMEFNRFRSIRNVFQKQSFLFLQNNLNVFYNFENVTTITYKHLSGRISDM
jgi:hypothetical protein